MGAGASAPLESHACTASGSCTCADPYRVVYTECIAVMEAELSRLGTRELGAQQSLDVMRLVRHRYGEVMDTMIHRPAWSVPEMLARSEGAGQGSEAGPGNSRETPPPTLRP